MASRKNLRSASLAGLLAVILLLSACSASSDPETWDAADADGKVEENFLRACTEADAGATGDAQALADYCGCSYDALRVEFDADFEGFTALEGDIRSDPEAIPANVRTLLDACAAQHLS